MKEKRTHETVEQEVQEAGGILYLTNARGHTLTRARKHGSRWVVERFNPDNSRPHAWAIVCIVAYNIPTKAKAVWHMLRAEEEGDSHEIL